MLSTPKASQAKKENIGSVLELSFEASIKAVSEIINSYLSETHSSSTAIIEKFGTTENIDESLGMLEKQKDKLTNLQERLQIAPIQIEMFRKAEQAVASLKRVLPQMFSTEKQECEKLLRHAVLAMSPLEDDIRTTISDLKSISEDISDPKTGLTRILKKILRDSTEKHPEIVEPLSKLIKAQTRIAASLDFLNNI